MVRGGEETIRQINLTTHMKYLIMCPRYDWVAFVIHEKKVVIKLYLYKTSSLAFLFVCLFSIQAEFIQALLNSIGSYFSDFFSPEMINLALTSSSLPKIKHV